MSTIQVKSFNAPDETHLPPKMRIEVIHFGDISVTRGTVQPGWKWSEHIRPLVGTESAQESHFSYVISGRFHAAMDDGTEVDLGPGDVAMVSPGHDAWVVGDEPCVLLDMHGVIRKEQAS